MTNEKSFYSFDAQAGRAAILILAGGLSPTATASFVGAFQRRTRDFACHEADVLLLVDGQGPHAQEYLANPPEGLEVVCCPPEVFYRWGFAHLEPLVVVTDRSVRIVAPIDAEDDEAAVGAALACLAATPVEAPRDIPLPAPVLLLPNILSASFCLALIDRFESGGHLPGGMASVDVHGAAIHKIDDSKKKRKDYILPADDALGAQAVEALARICVPEMKRAFQCDISHIDRMIIARYDDTGGYFRRHRDNSGPSVAFRQFALSINLNSQDYEGGHLLFPEYNSHRYKPERGAGIIFSASLLHEAAPVTKGRRYVLLTFLHNAGGEAQRQAFLTRSAAVADEAASA
jgi:predicted 2-oxoglutarate/Fe(II)-dependent dioxygenase YbiX